METELMEIRKKLERMKAKKAGLEGERKSLMARLKKEYNITSLDGAEKKLEELKKSVKSKEKRKELLMEKIDSRLSEMED